MKLSDEMLKAFGESFAEELAADGTIMGWIIKVADMERALDCLLVSEHEGDIKDCINTWVPWWAAAQEELM